VEIVVTEGLLLELGDATTVEMMAIGLVTARLGTGETSAIDVVNGVTLSAIATIVPSLQAGAGMTETRVGLVHALDLTHHEAHHHVVPGMAGAVAEATTAGV